MACVSFASLEISFLLNRSLRRQNYLTMIQELLEILFVCKDPNKVSTFISGKKKKKQKKHLQNNKEFNKWKKAIVLGDLIKLNVISVWGNRGYRFDPLWLTHFSSCAHSLEVTDLKMNRWRQLGIKTKSVTHFSPHGSEYFTYQ